MTTTTDRPRDAKGHFVKTEELPPDPVATDDVDKDARIKQLEKQVRAAKREAEAQQTEIDMLKPTIDLSGRLFKDEDDVREWFEEQQLRDMAESGLVDENRIRQRRGLSPLRYTEEEWEAAVELVVEELLQSRTLNGAPEEGPLMRVIKMWNPKDRSIREIPYEGQFNNIAGSLQDGLARYTIKGFKQIRPMLCASGMCNEVAAVAEKGKKAGTLTWFGYCSEDHFNRTEKRNAAELPGVVNRASVSAPAR